MNFQPGSMLLRRCAKAAAVAAPWTSAIAWTMTSNAIDTANLVNVILDPLGCTALSSLDAGFYARRER
jgi:hypothetical protein